MKLHSLFFNISIFAIVLIFFICPSLFSAFPNSGFGFAGENIFSKFAEDSAVGFESGVDFSTWNFPLQQALLFFVAVFIYYNSADLRNLRKKEMSSSDEKIDCDGQHRFFPLSFLFYPSFFSRKNLSKGPSFFLYFFTPFFFSFILLFFNSLIFSFLSTFDIFESAAEIPVKIPSSFCEWIFCILNFLFAAFFEEVIYRFYFIDELDFLINKKNCRALKCFAETAGLLIFAFSHFYMGFLSVLNAALAHVILRLCYKKSGNIFAGTASHFCYNIISLILL